MPTNGSILDRLWHRLEDRYDTESASCGCGSAPLGRAVLDETDLTMDDIRDYQRGDRSITDIVATVDVELDAARIDDLGTLVDELNRVLESGDGEPASDTPRR